MTDPWELVVECSAWPTWKYLDRRACRRKEWISKDGIWKGGLGSDNLENNIIRKEEIITRGI